MPLADPNTYCDTSELLVRLNVIKKISTTAIESLEYLPISNLSFNKYNDRKPIIISTGSS